MRMSAVQVAARSVLSVRAFERQAQRGGNSSHSVVRNSHNQFKGAISFPLPDPGRAHAVSHSFLQCAKTIRIALIVGSKILSLCPKRPVVSAQVQNVEHGVLAKIYPRLIDRDLRNI